MKKIVFICLSIILVPLNAAADIIIFKDGMKTVCHDRAWEEDGAIKCEYQGSILTYQKNDVLRIEKVRIESNPAKAIPKARDGSQKTAVHGSQAVQSNPSAPEKQQQSRANYSVNLKIKGLKFYDPRRPYKYRTDSTAKYNTFKEAIAALAKHYHRSPEWVQHHMGNTNDLAEIHRNLSISKQNAPAKIQAIKSEEGPGILFYNPRRPQKYWTSTTARHDTFKQAISALAKEYDRSQEWVQQHMGSTNKLNEIHHNLSKSKSAESSP